MVECIKKCLFDIGNCQTTNHITRQIRVEYALQVKISNRGKISSKVILNSFNTNATIVLICNDI